MHLRDFPLYEMKRTTKHVYKICIIIHKRFLHQENIIVFPLLLEKYQMKNKLISIQIVKVKPSLLLTTVNYYSIERDPVTKCTQFSKL